MFKMNKHFSWNQHALFFVCMEFFYQVDKPLNKMLLH